MQMVEGTARERVKRAANTQTRVAGQLHGPEVGDMVDLYRSPRTKDSVGWRGPATVLSILNIPHGFIDVSCGGRASVLGYRMCVGR